MIIGLLKIETPIKALSVASNTTEKLKVFNRSYFILHQRQMTKMKEKVNEEYNQVLEDICTRFLLNCPAEEYDSFERLFFQIEEAHWFYSDFYREKNKKLPKLNFSEFSLELFKKFDFLQPYLHLVENNVENFKNYKSQVPVCGAILVNKNATKLLLVQGYQSSKSWTFPKGKINKNELETDCAIREVKEEIGYDITSKLDPTKFVTFLAEKKKLIKLFVIENVSEKTKFETQTRKEIGNIAWHSFDDISKNTSKYFYVTAFLKDLKKIVHSKKTLKNTNVVIKDIKQKQKIHEEKESKTLKNTNVIVLQKKKKMKDFSFKTDEIF